MKFLSQINVNTEYTLPIVDGSNGQVLATNGNGTVYWGSISAGATNLDGLTDVILTSPSSGQLLRYGIPPGSGEANPVWYNFTPNYLTPSSSIDALSDVTISTATTGQILQWNGSAWVNATLSTVDYVSKVQHLVKCGVAVTKGQAVYVTSADGTNMIVGLASNATEAESSKVIGIAASNGAINAQIFVVTEGLVAGLNTSTATAGDAVWLGTGGNLIFGLLNKPVAPANLVYLGVVTRVQQNNGEIFVNVQNGFELKELHDVLINGVSAGQLLRRDSDGLWKNWTPNYLTSLPTHNHDDRYYTESEIVAFFGGETEIAGYNQTNWDTAYGWGDHATAGYLTSFTEADTLATVAARGNISNTKLQIRTAGNTSGGNLQLGPYSDGASKWAYITAQHYNSSTEPEGFTLIGGLAQNGQNAVVIGGNIYESNPATEIQFWTHTSDTHSTGGSQIATIKPNGLGIGTTNPSYKLDLLGTTDAVVARLSQGFERVRYNSVDLLGYNDGHLWLIGNNNPSLVISSSWDWDRQVEINYVPNASGAASGVLSIGQLTGQKNSATYTHGRTDFYVNGAVRSNINTYGVGIGRETASNEKFAINAAEGIWALSAYRSGVQIGGIHVNDSILNIQGSGGTEVRISTSGNATWNGNVLATQTWVGANYYNTGQIEDFFSGAEAISGYNKSNWDTAYNDRITAASVTGTGTKTLTLTQGDGGTVTATWTDYDTDTDAQQLTWNPAQTELSISGGNDVTLTGLATEDYVNSQGFVTSVQNLAIQTIGGDSGAFNLDTVSGQHGFVRFSTGSWAGTNPYPGNYSHILSINQSTAHGNRFVQMYLGDVPGALFWRMNQGGTIHPWERIWTAGNDGASSGLDADLLDGNHASAFALVSHNHDDRYYTETESDSRFVNASGDTMSGSLSFDQAAVIKKRITQNGFNPVKTSSGVLTSISDNSSGYTYYVIETNVPQDDYQMGGFTIELFGRYGETNNKTKIDLAGYWNPEGNSGFVGFEAHGTNPQYKPTIEVSRNSQGNTAFIIYGVSWSYPIIVARDLWLGYNSTDGGTYGEGWTIRGTNDVSSYTNKDTVVWRNAYSDSNPAGYITGYTETDTLASVTGRGATTSSKVFFTHHTNSDPLSAVEINGGGTHTGLYINPAASSQAHVRFGTNGTLKWQIRAPFQDGVDTALKFYSWVSGADKFQFEHSGNAIFNGGNVWTSANDGSGSGLDADLLDGYNHSNFIGLNGNSYFQLTTWLQSTGNHGFYSPSSGAGTHFYPAVTSYGSFRIEGGANSFLGIELFTLTRKPTWMWDNNGGGMYSQSDSVWYYYYSHSSGRLHIGASSGNAVWHSGDFTSTNISNWNAAYNDRITAVAVSGTGTKTLTLTQQDGGTLTATWTDYDTDNDAQTLSWDQGQTLLSISGGNDVTLTGLATEDYVNSQGFVTSSGTVAGVVRTVTGTNSAELVRGNMGDNDQARILVGATASNAGYLEIATADDGTEPIYVRQYTGVFSSLTRTATLLDGSGNTTFPGNLTIGGTFTENSSIRFKENIQPLEPALAKVEQLNPVTYTKITSQEEEIGLIAEEVAELFPEVVTYNENGQPQGIQYQRLSVILLKAVQELTERVNKLENK